MLSSDDKKEEEEVLLRPLLPNDCILLLQSSLLYINAALLPLLPGGGPSPPSHLGQPGCGLMEFLMIFLSRGQLYILRSEFLIKTLIFPQGGQRLAAVATDLLNLLTNIQEL